MLKHAIDVADVSLWPMTLLTNRLSRTHVVWETNRPIEVIANGMVKLLHTVQFRFEVRRRARTDMERNAFDASVRSVLIAHELRLHRQMTSLAAKSYRLSISIRLITAERRDKQECHA